MCPKGRNGIINQIKKTMGTNVSILEAILVSAVSLIGLLVFMRVVEIIKSKKQ